MMWDCMTFMWRHLNVIWSANKWWSNEDLHTFTCSLYIPTMMSQLLTQSIIGPGNCDASEKWYPTCQISVLFTTIFVTHHAGNLISMLMVFKNCLDICIFIITRNLFTYRQVSNIRCTLIGNKIVDYLDVVGASPVGAAPTTSLFST